MNFNTDLARDLRPIYCIRHRHFASLPAAQLLATQLTGKIVRILTLLGVRTIILSLCLRRICVVYQNNILESARAAVIVAACELLMGLLCMQYELLFNF